MQLWSDNWYVNVNCTLTSLFHVLQYFVVCTNVYVCVFVCNKVSKVVVVVVVEKVSKGKKTQSTISHAIANVSTAGHCPGMGIVWSRTGIVKRVDEYGLRLAWKHCSRSAWRRCWLSPYGTRSWIEVTVDNADWPSTVKHRLELAKHTCAFIINTRLWLAGMNASVNTASE